MTAFIRLGLILWALVQAFPAGGNATPAPSPRPAAVAGSPLPQRVYIWQRVWSPALCRSLRAHAGEFATLDVLAAELSFAGAAPAASYAAPDWALLRELGVPVALVVRVGPCRSTWGPDTAEARLVLAAGARVLAQARAGGVEPVELQLDYDSATSRLREYGGLLRQVRTALAPPRLAITTLPTWLGSADFGALVAGTDTYVLQVHGLDRPDAPDRPYVLCDPGRAARWIRQAAALGRPFRVALPAYGYRVAVDLTGQFRGLQAEGRAKAWPLGTTKRAVWADPPQIARLVGELLAHPPAACESLCWFRFPCEDDRLAWRWPTLAEVMNGREPRADLVMHTCPGEDGALDIVLENRGTNQAAPVPFRVNWRGAKLVAAEGAGGWRCERDGEGRIVLTPPAGDAAGPVFPGDSVRVGWLRLDATVVPEAVPVAVP